VLIRTKLYQYSFTGPYDSNPQLSNLIQRTYFQHFTTCTVLPSFVSFN
jgi:hypothetical protein